jgi:hypothetical protein
VILPSAPTFSCLLLVADVDHGVRDATRNSALIDATAYSHIGVMRILAKGGMLLSGWNLRGENVLYLAGWQFIMRSTARG